MGRPRRAAQGGLVYHTLNRANARLTIFENQGDFTAFERILAEAVSRYAMRLLAYCLMPNHFHLLLWPRGDRDLSQFMQWLTLTHTQRWHAHHHTAGSGHLYQGRFKSFPVQSDDHFLTVCRYVERNAVRAKLVKSAQDWPWCSPGKRAGRQSPLWLLSLKHWPVRPQSGWMRHVNRADTTAELLAMRTCVRRGRPYGDERWEKRTAKQLGLESTLRTHGRQRLPIKDSRPL